MTHQNHQTNGASLEDCHTNFFALTDLCGIKWRKFLLGDKPNLSWDPLDDPILRSYSRCLECDILCVWRRVTAPKQEPDPNNTITYDIVSPHVHPPLALNAAKELWIFWYGEEPDLEGLVDPELLKTSESANNSHGAWESGLSYECRSLLFKALHNLIERCLLSKDLVRLGKWFVQPCTTNDRIFGKSSQHLSFSFAFFVHGDTVCASIDLREHPAIRPLSPEYLAEAASAQANSDARPKTVILAPFGLAAVLTGNSYKAVDPTTEKLLEDWCSFYPLCNKDNSDLPPIVEVISGGVKMRYPSKYVLVTDLDDPQIPTNDGSANQNVNESKPLSLYDTSSNNFGNTANIHVPPSAATAIPERVWQDCITNPLASLNLNATSTMNNNQNSNNNNTATTPTPTATNTTACEGDNQSSDNSSTNNNNNNNNNSTDSKASWEFVDPTQKTICTCTKCRKPFGGNRTSSSSGLSSSSAGSSKLSGSSRSDKSARFNRIPFHKRHNNINNNNNNCGQSANVNNNNNNSQRQLQQCLTTTKTVDGIVTGYQNAATTTGINLMGSNAAAIEYNITSSAAAASGELAGDTYSALDTLPNQRATNPGTPHGGASSYSRNSIGDSMPVPSVGSPGSAAPSPHPNSTLSQPTSVPPPDQLLSPRPPTSVPNMQPPTPLEQHLDKNTPAATPTDQHDNKSITASPYIQPTPSVEPPPSAEPAVPSGTGNGGGGVKKFEIGVSNNNDQRSTNNNNNNGPGNVGNNNSSMNNFISLLKRPQLSTKDYENSVDDDFLVPQLLYDYSSWDAWMDHPVKRFKPNDDVKPSYKKMRGRNLYDGQTHSQPPMPSPTSSALGLMMSSDNQIKREITGDGFDPVPNEENNILAPHEIKKEPMADCKDKTQVGNLYTSEGLQVSYKDLDQIFDNSDDNSTDETLQVHTPPDSNKSNGCGIDDIKRSINSNNPNTSILRPEELSKMFPTPPSHEHHPNSSPCSGGIMDIPMTDITEGIKIKQEIIYPDLGSPADEPIEDWSYVFIPPTICKFVGSSKYAPLTNLPSQSLPSVMLPPNCVYKPSWQQPQRQQDQQQQQQQQQHQQHPQQIPQQSSIRSNTPHNNINNSTNSRSGTPNNMALSMIESQKIQQLQQPMLINQLQCPPTTPTMMHQMALRTGMSPISPAPGSTMQGFPTGSPMNHHMNSCRRTPIHPPPPYELAVSSPATSTSSYLNKQFNSQEPETPTAPARAPEANSLVVNVLLYDTAMNVFRDHNFDSCTLCVCNADASKCVGNIRGSDSGVYVALPGTSFNPAANNGMLGGVNAGIGGGSMRNLSAFGGIDSPSCTGNGANGNQHLTGYIDEDPIRCQCGFSAVVNRRLAHRSGLFYEDEMEITGMAEDPAVYKKKSLISFMLNSSETSSADRNANEAQLPQTIMDLLRDQCTIIQTSSSSIQRALARYRRRNRDVRSSNVLNILEYNDANDVIALAIDQGRIAFEASCAMNNRMDVEPYRASKSNVSVHRWPYVVANGTRNNQDIVRIMKSMQPVLQNAFHAKCQPRPREATYTVKGPLTWRQFHRLAGRGTGQCEPQPIPSVIVGHEKDWLSVAPYAIYYWDKLLLEPYSYSRDVVYLVVAPDNDFIVNKARTYFKELSTTYEMCKLGRHTPIKGWDGILQVGSKTCRGSNSTENTPLEEWFQMLGNSKLAEQIRMYANAFQNMLVPYLQRVPNDKSLLDPPEGMNSNSNANMMNKDRPLPSPMPPPSTPDPSQPGDKAPSTPKSENEQETQRESLNTSTTSNSPVTDPTSSSDDDINPPVIVIYVVEPFTCGSDSSDVERIACLSLLRCYSELLSTIPESVRCNINLQIISSESILELGRNRSRIRLSDEMKCLALSVFSQCRKFLSHTSKVKSLTGFGTAANMELFLKNKDDKNRAAYKMYTPPYILAPLHEKSEKTDTFRLKSVEQQYSVMYCNYCVSEDQGWLLATATDDRGELLETISINIDIPNRSRRRRAPARRLGLQKLMDFILGIISQTVQPWRLVVGRIGRIGHGELKSWSWLLSKQNLQKASKQLKDICKQCSLMYPHSVPCILSACLVTLEPDSKLRVMPDQFTPDERFSQISMQNPLSTPQDVTCTHILVFPTSAVSQSFQKAFNELNEPQVFENDDNLIFDFGEDPEDPIGDVNSLGEIFDWDDQVQMQQTSPERNSNHGSPGRMEDNRSRQSSGPGGNTFNSARNMHDAQDMEEVGTVLQQPLAVGYFVSTAPTGRMPSWFWASCPHLEDVCPVFLKTALHLHIPAIQQTTDELLAQNHSSANDHPLDSSLTADVLRYVLEGYNVLSWLALDSNTHDRLSCLPIHVQVLMQLYHMTAAMA